MNRIKQMMKQTENSGTLNVRKKAAFGLFKGTYRTVREHCRFAVTGLVLLSAGMYREADAATTLTWVVDYTVGVNTCTITVGGRDSSELTGAMTGQNGGFTLDWGTISRTDYFDSMRKIFGMVMTCTGDIYKPTLSITGDIVSESPPYIYVSSVSSSPIGFRVKLSSDSTDNQSLTGVYLTKGGSAIAEHNTGNIKKIILEAQPSILPGKSLPEGVSTESISGTVTINVNYN